MARGHGDKTQDRLMAQEQDRIKMLERKVRKLERELKAVIEATGTQTAVEQAEQAAAEESQAKSTEIAEKFGNLSRDQRR
jgi:hypothetical protein